MEMPELDNWSVNSKTLDPYKAPETGMICLVGIVKGHPGGELSDGERITTSKIESINLETKVAKTLSREYKLLEPDPEWLKWLESNGHKLEDYHIPMGASGNA